MFVGSCHERAWEQSFVYTVSCTTVTTTVQKCYVYTCSLHTCSLESDCVTEHSV